MVELLLRPETLATAAVEAIRSLKNDSSAMTEHAILSSLSSRHPTVRIEAVSAIQERGLLTAAHDWLVSLIRSDPSWLVRRTAVSAVWANPHSQKWDAMIAATDPHWRVRHIVAEALFAWAQYGEDQQRAEHELSRLGDSLRIRRLMDFLRYRWHSEAPPIRPDVEDLSREPFWDDDPAVLARNLERFGREGRRSALDVLTQLICHPEARVHAWIVTAIRDDGEPVHWAAAMARLNDPREDAAAIRDLLLRGVELDRIEAAAKFILSRPTPNSAALEWALAQIGDAFPIEDVQADLDRLGVTSHTFAEREHSPLEHLVLPPDHPHARADSLTVEEAHRLIEQPTLETSWHVLQRAARMCKVPIWKITPAKPWVPAETREREEVMLSLTVPIPIRPRTLGPDGPVVSPLGLSGHYGLPVEGFVRAVESGVNLFFWEPGYATLTRFMNQLAAFDRRHVHLLGGTFEADGKRIRRDAERALRNLRVDRLAVFLLFWTRSWQRVPDDVRDTLERLRTEGKVQVYGLSTHNRTLAAEAIREGWNPVMVRHSAAHRKAETDVFPIAQERGTSIITFNNTCYGRLLDRGNDREPAFTPSDCYRFTLGTPGVSACFTAPATLEQLEENLEALRNPHLDAERRVRLLQRGEWLYREDTVFRRTIRAGG